ncbi:MAG: hypothetical protein LWW74_04610 [Burkholderiales bacterium]|nr:hypothetical protein [Burkholderiales bacterium]MCE1176539.1 hypothetical protein [Burkholderiales bacterium]
MYGIPKDLDLSEIVGQSTSQIRVGQFDLQFSFGNIHFLIESSVVLVSKGQCIGKWQAGVWPTQCFFEVMNTEVVKYEVSDNTKIIIYLENGIELHLIDDSKEFESMTILNQSDSDQWII